MLTLPTGWELEIVKVLIAFAGVVLSFAFQVSIPGARADLLVITVPFGASVAALSKAAAAGWALLFQGDSSSGAILGGCLTLLALQVMAFGWIVGTGSTQQKADSTLKTAGMLLSNVCLIAAILLALNA